MARSGALSEPRQGPGLASSPLSVALFSYFRPSSLALAQSHWLCGGQGWQSEGQRAPVCVGGCAWALACTCIGECAWDCA